MTGFPWISVDVKIRINKQVRGVPEICAYLRIDLIISIQYRIINLTWRYVMTFPGPDFCVSTLPLQATGPCVYTRQIAVHIYVQRSFKGFCDF